MKTKITICLAAALLATESSEAGVYNMGSDRGRYSVGEFFHQNTGTWGEKNSRGTVRHMTYGRNNQGYVFDAQRHINVSAYAHNKYSRGGNFGVFLKSRFLFKNGRYGFNYQVRDYCTARNIVDPYLVSTQDIEQTWIALWIEGIPKRGADVLEVDFLENANVRSKANGRHFRAELNLFTGPPATRRKVWTKNFWYPKNAWDWVGGTVVHFDGSRYTNHVKIDNAVAPWRKSFYSGWKYLNWRRSGVDIWGRHNAVIVQNRPWLYGGKRYHRCATVNVAKIQAPF